MLITILSYILIQFYKIVKISVLIKARNQYLYSFELCMDWAVQKKSNRFICVACEAEMLCFVRFFWAHPFILKCFKKRNMLLTFLSYILIQFYNIVKISVLIKATN